MTDPSGGSGRPNPATARDPSEFVDAMRRLKRWCGLGFRQLERRAGAAGYALPRSTLTAALARDTLPREDLVAAFARICGCSAGEVERWVAARRRLAATASTPPQRQPAEAAAVPAQLPPGVGGFVGRTSQLDELTAVLTTERPTVAIAAIAGTAGVGKTALAVHWAHRVADRFPHGQLYINLRGFDPSGVVMAPAEAIRTLLDALEVPPQRIPASLDAQVALYRTLLAGKRVLVLLDNVRDADQVRPLLPGSPGCLVVVTSRNQLTSLVATHGAHPIALDVMPVVEARELLACRLGAERVTAEPEAVEEIITGCARLPLALAIVAARGASNQRLPLRSLADELRNNPNQLDALNAGDSATNMRAVFSWSYQRLDKHVARMFRLLAIHPGPDIALPAAASLAGIPLDRARDVLGELTRAHLVSEHAPGRYTFHDLLRRYATELADIYDTDEERRAALHRLLDHFLRAGYAAARLLNPYRILITPVTAERDTTTVHLVDYQQAMTWFITEHVGLLATIELAARSGFEVHAWQLAWTMRDFLDRRGHWHEWISIQTTVLDAARRIADREGQAHAHRCIGTAHFRAGRYPEAHRHITAALDLFGELGHDVGVAFAHLDLSSILGDQDRHREALQHATAALDGYRAAGHRAGQARALNAIGWSHTQLGEHHDALAYCKQALTLAQAAGCRVTEAATWDSLADIHRSLGDHQQALVCYRRALAKYDEADNRYYTAIMLSNVGDIHHARGETTAARDAWERALRTLNELHHPDTDKVSAKLLHLHHTRPERR